VKLQDLPSIYFQDALTLLCGDLLGSGVSRQTYVYAADKNYVVKMQHSTADFQNQTEWKLWHDLKGVEGRGLDKWLAPCIRISDMGTWMIQKRTTPVTLDYLKKKYNRIPEMFTDLKADNWGLLDGKLVCHDYGRLVYHVKPILVKAKWWDHTVTK
jgi:hypothetical protein